MGAGGVGIKDVGIAPEAALGGEVDSSNPFAATVWEGEILRHHFDPRIRDAVKAVEKNVIEAR